MALYLLDTHAWLWAMSEAPSLRRQSLVLIEQAQREQTLFVPAFAVWEIAQKESTGKLVLEGGLDLLMLRSFAPGKLKVAELTVETLIAANRLPGDPHGDPADRIIIATAREGGFTLLTHNDRILKYARKGHVRAVKV